MLSYAAGWGQSPPALPVITPVEGLPFAGLLVEADSAWMLTFRTGEMVRKLPAADLVIYGHFREPGRGPLVLFADGGLLVADILKSEQSGLLVTSPILTEKKIPIDKLAAVVFQPPVARQQRDLLLDQAHRATGREDRLLLANGDELQGMFKTLAEHTLTFRTALGEMTLDTRQVVALVFDPSLRREWKAEGLRAWLGLSDGGRLLVNRLRIKEDVAEVGFAGDQQGEIAAERLVALQPLGGRATYLSDIKPQGYRHVPFLELTWPYQIDRNVKGGMLRCGGRLWLKGLGVHSAARLTYSLEPPSPDPGYRRFEAEVGIDDSTEGGGSVRFRVLVDGQEKFTSEIVRGGAATLPVSVDVAGAKRLDLVVDFADRGDVLDHANWLNPRLVR
jgi:hypothetical protein